MVNANEKQLLRVDAFTTDRRVVNAWLYASPEILRRARIPNLEALEEQRAIIHTINQVYAEGRRLSRVEVTWDDPTSPLPSEYDAMRAILARFVKNADNLVNEHGCVFGCHGHYEPGRGYQHQSPCPVAEAQTFVRSSESEV